MTTEEDVWRAVGSKYSALIHLTDEGEEDIRRLTELAHDVPHGVALDMIARGTSWRERLAGLVLARRADPTALATAILASLREPTGLAITPGCAALAALCEVADVPTLLNSVADHLDRQAFDGDLGWALDRVEEVMAGEAVDASRSPNSGQRFSDHFLFYRDLYRADE